MFLAVAAAFADTASAQALPTGQTVAAGNGSAVVNTTGSSMTVTTSQRAIIDWTTFNIGNGASVQFIQPGSTSIAVNRVGLGGGASAIDGTLSANGHVMLLNPNGVMFGATAVVNVAGLIASTGNINDAQFMASATSPVAITGATGGSISNHGNITITGAGLAAFVAPSLSNSGQIVASSGRITLASAQAATVSFNGGLYEIAVNQGVAGGSIANTGTLSAPGGAIVLSALDAANVVSGAINLSGIQQASRIEVHGGHVTLMSDLDATTVTGTSRTIEVCGCAQIQDAVDIAKIGTPGNGATVNVEGGTRAEQVIIGKPYLTISGHDDATVTIGAGQTAFNIAADGVTVEGMHVVGPYSQPYTAVNLSAQPDITAGFTIQPGVSGATVRDNDIRNVRAGVLMLGSAPSAVITGNLIDNTKGSILVRSNGATISGNRFGVFGNEWDIVFLNGVTDGAYFTSPHTSEASYGAGVMAMSADNNGMHILDRRYGSNGLLGSTPQFGNRSHIVVSAGSGFTAADDFNLGNGLGNARQPLGNLQAGIDAVVPGGFMDVKAGAYVLSSTLNVDKALTLTGAGEANTLIDARTVSGYGMLVTGDDVSLGHFTLYGPQANVGTSYGIKVQPAGSGAAARLHDFSISHVTSRGAGRAELDLNGVIGATIDHVTANGAPVGNDSGTTAGAGIQITDSASVTISNSTTLNNAWGGVALFQANRFFDQQVDNVTVQSNNTFNEANPLYMQDESASRDFGTNQLQGFQYAVRNSADNQYTWLQYQLGNALSFATSGAAPLSSYVQGWNGTARTQNFYVGSGMSIMQAVNQASAGASVNVGAGTFAEQLTVNKDLTLTGAGSASTIVQPTSLTADADGMRNILTIGGGADVEVSDFTFRGPVPAITAGIFVRGGANAYIHDNRVLDIRESVAISGNQRGIGIFVGRAALNTSATATIADNEIRGYQKGGIVVDGPGSQATIVGNTVVGEGPTTAIAQNGIQISRGASATLSSNDVRGNAYTGPMGNADDFAAGILFFTSQPYVGTGGMSFGADNVVTGNQVGIWTNDRGPLTTTDLAGVSGNTRNAVAFFNGGYVGQGSLLEYPAWSASNTSLLSAAAFGGAQTGDIVDVGGTLIVTGWSGFGTIQPAIAAVSAGGTVNVSGGTYAENVVINSPRNLLFSDTTLQSLTVNAAGSGIGGSATATGSGGFMFNAPVVLLSDTSLSTAGANIVFNGDIQNAGATPRALSLSAGTGNVSLVSGGSSANPLGHLDVTGNNFSLAATMWVSGYEIDAAGTVSLSVSTLRSIGGDSGSISAGGDITGSTVSEGPVDIQSGGDVLMHNIISSGGITIDTAGTVVANIESPTVVIISAGEPPIVTGSAPHVVLDAPGGSLNGNFGDVTNAGGSIVTVNGRQEVPAASGFDPSRVLPPESSANASASMAMESENVAFSTSDDERRGRHILPAAPQQAAEILELGFGVELDLSPRNLR
jgi:filamentous hemagglutinin family protein